MVVTKNEHYNIIKHPICIKCKTTVTPNKILSGYKILSGNNLISILYGNIQYNERLKIYNPSHLSA